MTKSTTLTALARAKSGRALVDFYLAVFRGNPVPLGRLPTLAERMKAASWLADVAFGPVIQPVTIISRGPGSPRRRIRVTSQNDRG